MDVRLATDVDAEAIETIRVRGWQAAYRHVYPVEDLDALEVDAGRWHARLAAPPEGWTTVVAVDGRRVLGFATVGPSRDEDDLGELYAIYVDPGEWSTGAGRALLQRAEELLAAEYEEATLWVLDENPRARRFYEAFGWTADGGRKAVERLGVRAPEVRYRKMLSSSSRS
ncbi:MAG TPA: GNAT family N-acetyltransferase [Gaiellaceae bacterium]|nr:GNAT family N-acetyltransferase [Gaiellaceae bacterium]